MKKIAKISLLGFFIYSLYIFIFVKVDPEDLEKLNLIKLVVTKKNKICVLNIAQTDNISITNRSSLLLTEHLSLFELIDHFLLRKNRSNCGK